ncbi:DUF1611 domain-containing protein [Blastopirellula marina]|uniref:DUF1611 domain-containing protein n=1 Tax=Blastopirellula marina TaxID=124 RepID=A0A2S8GBS4_9BACT|nr:DUF1611 domain-containing protein [Blastopirellula marina]PQO41908.1 DUF1611 domain-containing protein [Blastopirellula marina]PTL46266.1 DUF1611 domain-containing protein [Blastopirellula marina]
MSTTENAQTETPKSQPKTNTPLDLTSYHRIVVLTEGHTTPFSAKTAIGLLRFRGEDVVALLDSQAPASTTGECLGHGGDTPIVASLSEVDRPDALFIGISPPGGRLPAAMRKAIYDAAEAGIDVVSGLHDHMIEDEELAAIASRTGAKLIDVRRNRFRDTAKHATFPENSVRVHTVGHDCSVGKMFTALEIERELLKRNENALFLATGQTGIMISGRGIPIDSVVSDFVNGSIEGMILENSSHDYLLIEGQGSAVHPAFSAVTVGLLHGCAPHGLILCYEATRETTKGLDHVPLKSLSELRTLYEMLASARNPCQVIGVAMNGRRISPEEAEVEKARVAEELGLPVCDVYRDGPGVLADAVLELGKKVRS